MKDRPHNVPPLVAAAAISAAAASLGWYQFQQVTAANEAAAATEAELDARQAELDATREEVAQLAEQLAAEKEKSDSLADDKRQAERKAKELQQLAEIDPELLAKYSKVFFLNENYAPANLDEIPSKYVADGKELEIHEDVLPFLRKMIDAAKEDGVSLLVRSAYRSFDEQTSLKNGYTVTYGTTAANRFSADQGYSEHQLGTTVDLTSQYLKSLDGFDKSDSFLWLQDNAYRYGFILSYPEGNAYYTYEPWHWRFVGRDLARWLHRNGKNFYDLDQREINSYRAEMFD